MKDTSIHFLRAVLLILFFLYSNVNVLYQDTKWVPNLSIGRVWSRRVWQSLHNILYCIPIESYWKKRPIEIAHIQDVKINIFESKILFCLFVCWGSARSGDLTGTGVAARGAVSKSPTPGLERFFFVISSLCPWLRPDSNRRPLFQKRWT